MPMFNAEVADAVVLVWRQSESVAASTGTALPRKRFYVIGPEAFIWCVRRPTGAAFGGLDLVQTAAVALSGSASVTGDVQSGTTFNLAQSAAVGLSASASVSGDLQFGTAFDLAQSGAIALSGSAAVSGDIHSSTAPVVVAPTITPAGRAARRVRRVVVEIDGEDFIVESPEQAAALLDKAKEEAEKRAKVQIERATKAEKRKPGKVLADARKVLVAPQITAPGLEDYASKILADIRDTYTDAMRTIEVSALLRQREREEEDDEDVLLLML